MNVINQYCPCVGIECLIILNPFNHIFIISRMFTVADEVIDGQIEGIGNFNGLISEI
jgi:hypothetical protein